MSSIITLSLVGLIVGFVFSMPIAGPISILITSNALKGKRSYCNLAAIGASVADFIYVFVAVFGLTRFYSFFKPAIPYILLVGIVFLIYLGYKISKTKIDLEHIKDEKEILHIKKERNGFLTGFLLNFLNPTLFFGWLTSSFIVISLASAMGFSTGGLEEKVDSSFNSINKKGEDTALRNKALHYLHIDAINNHNKNSSVKENNSAYFSLLSAVLFALFLSIGGIIWFFYLAYLLSKHRHRVNISIINSIIRALGYALYGFGLFLGYHAIGLLKT